MPEISRFFGIVIAMYFDDHKPPHFHARYGDQQASVAILTNAVVEGSLSPRVLGLVVEWSAAHTPELVANWERARARAPLLPIAPIR